MILNHEAAIEMLVKDADAVGFDAFTFKNLHAVLSQELKRGPWERDVEPYQGHHQRKGDTPIGGVRVKRP